MKKNIFIVGARGYKFNYGGWETFVNNLILNNKNEDFEVAEKVEERNGTVVKNFLKKVLKDSKADELLLGVFFA